MQDAYRLSAFEGRQAVLAGKLTLEAYVACLLLRIEERDPVVRAWCFLDKEAVLGEARRLDRQAHKGKLYGTVVGVKDVFYVKGTPTKYQYVSAPDAPLLSIRTYPGSPLYDDNRARDLDAGTIMSMRAEGALFLGKLHTTEFAATYIGGPSTNPHDPKRTPGGSSSGSGAAVGDLQVPLALGTQTLGSVIRPGSYNGIYSMKFTHDAVTREGQRMTSTTLDTFGAFARDPRDFDLLADTFDLSDDEVIPPHPLDLKQCAFGIYKTTEWESAGAGTRAAMTKGFEILKAAGATVEEIDFPSLFAPLSEYHRVICAAEARTSLLGEYKTDSARMHATLRDLVTNKDGITKRQLLHSYDGAAALRPIADDILSRYTAVVCPSAPDEPPIGIEHTGNPTLNKMWTLLGNPVIQCPGFAGENGMPIGLSLVSGRFRDCHLIRVAQTVGPLFEARGGWKRSL